MPSPFHLCLPLQSRFPLTMCVFKQILKPCHCTPNYVPAWTCLILWEQRANTVLHRPSEDIKAPKRSATPQSRLARSRAGCLLGHGPAWNRAHEGKEKAPPWPLIPPVQVLTCVPPGPTQRVCMSDRKDPGHLDLHACPQHRIGQIQSPGVEREEK